MVFRLPESIVGNMGEPLDYGFDEETEGEGVGLGENDAGQETDDILEVEREGDGLRKEFAEEDADVASSFWNVLDAKSMA